MDSAAVFFEGFSYLRFGSSVLADDVACALLDVALENNIGVSDVVLKNYWVSFPVVEHAFKMRIPSFERIVLRVDQPFDVMVKRLQLLGPDVVEKVAKRNGVSSTQPLVDVASCKGSYVLSDLLNCLPKQQWERFFSSAVDSELIVQRALMCEVLANTTGDREARFDTIATRLSSNPNVSVRDMAWIYQQLADSVGVDSARFDNLLFSASSGSIADVVDVLGFDNFVTHAVLHGMLPWEVQISQLDTRIRGGLRERFTDVFKDPDTAADYEDFLMRLIQLDLVDVTKLPFESFAHSNLVQDNPHVFASSVFGDVFDVDHVRRMISLLDRDPSLNLHALMVALEE